MSGQVSDSHVDLESFLDGQKSSNDLSPATDQDQQQQRPRSVVTNKWSKWTKQENEELGQKRWNDHISFAMNTSLYTTLLYTIFTFWRIYNTMDSETRMIQAGLGPMIGIMVLMWTSTTATIALVPHFRFPMTMGLSKNWVAGLIIWKLTLVAIIICALWSTFGPGLWHPKECNFLLQFALPLFLYCITYGFLLVAALSLAIRSLVHRLRGNGGQQCACA